MIYSLMAAGLATALVAGFAMAHDRTAQTSLTPVIQGDTLPDGSLLIFGRLTAPKPCLPDRKVVFWKRTDAGGEIVDVDRTSRNGALALNGDASDANLIVVKVFRKDVGRRGHRHICKADFIREAYTPPS